LIQIDQVVSEKILQIFFWLKYTQLQISQPFCMEIRCAVYNFDKEPLENHPYKVWLNLAQRFLRKRF